MRARRRSWAHPLLVLYAAPNDGGPSRSGFVIGRRVGKAVVRNRVKRRLREALRARYPAVVPGVDLVWIARPPSATADFRALDAAVAQLLQRAGLLRKRAPDPDRPGAERQERRATGHRPSTGNAGPTALTT